jgi:excisionase family DNA binding protein
MENYDLYKLLGDIKAEQEKTTSLLNDYLKGIAQERIYDLVDLKEVLKVSKRTIATWLQQGILPHTKVGAKIWVTEQQFKEFMVRFSNDSMDDKSLIKRSRRVQV